MTKLISKPDFRATRCFTDYEGKLLEVHESFATTGFGLTPEREVNVRMRIHEGNCDLCGRDFRQVHGESYMSGDIRVSERVVECEGCANWIGFFETSLSPTEWLVPFIRDFCPHSQVPALTALMEEVRATPERLFASKPRDFELFVGSVLKEFFNCDVYHVGKSGDGGIDLIVVGADQPLMVQVKRRKDGGAVEGVEVVRLLFASMFASGSTKGMVVTTAQRFSRDAKQWVHLPALRDNSYRIDLVAFDRLLKMTNSVRTSDDPPWSRAIPFWRGETPYLKHLVQMGLQDAVSVNTDGESLSFREHVSRRDGTDYWCVKGGCIFSLNSHGANRLFVFVDDDRSQCWELAPDILDHDQRLAPSRIDVEELLRKHAGEVTALGEAGFYDILHKAPVALIEEMIRRWAAAAGESAVTWDF